MLTIYSGDTPYCLISSKDNVFYLSLHSTLLKGFKIKATELDASTGKPIGQPTVLSSDSEVTSEDSILHVGINSGVPIVVWTDNGLKAIKINIIGTKQITTVNVPSGQGDAAEEIVVHASRSSTALPHILIHYKAANSHWAEVYHIDTAKGTAKKAFDLPLLGGKGGFSASSQGTNVFFTRHTAFENILLSSAAPDILNTWILRPESHGGMVGSQDITHAASEVISRGGSTYAVRSALSLPSGDWELIRNGELSWVRPEGLAGVTAAAFVDIAREQDLASELAAEGLRDPLAAYLHRVKRHMMDLQYLPDWAGALPNRLLGSFIGDKAGIHDQGLRRDGFGFHKIVLIATKRGRLAALDAGNQGKIIWNVQAVALEAEETWDVLDIEIEEGTAFIRAKGGDFLRVIVNTGRILQHQSGSMTKSFKTSVPVSDASGKKVLVPVNDNGYLGDLPNADFAKGTIIVTEGEDSVVRGWGIVKGTEPELVWRFMPASGERVESVIARPSHDPVASIGKALGDRNVLYKYLNPNLLLISAVGVETSTATFYLIDATSGSVIYSVTHPGVDEGQPIVSTISENWFAYSLFSESMAATQDAVQIDGQWLKDYQLVVSEIYESPYANDRGSLGSLSNFSTVYPTAAESDGTLASPHVISQTYLIPGPISSMSVTSTPQGITTRSLLCVLPDLKALISISKAFLDPRRPVGRDPTASEMEEGLFRYSPILDFEPKWILTHKRDIVSLSNIITSPSLLESTSLVFAFGNIDLFGSRVSPIGAFDILGKGFSKLQLVLTVVALAVGTTLVAPLVSIAAIPEHPAPDKISTDIFAGAEKANRWGLDSVRIFRPS